MYLSVCGYVCCMLYTIEGKGIGLFIWDTLLSITIGLYNAPADLNIDLEIGIDYEFTRGQFIRLLEETIIP